jgi:hypothetical protein
LLNGKADLSGGMALRIEKAFGVKMDTLMRMQADYDIAQTRKCAREILYARDPQFIEARVASIAGSLVPGAHGNNGHWDVATTVRLTPVFQAWPKLG